MTVGAFRLPAQQGAVLSSTPSYLRDVLGESIGRLDPIGALVDSRSLN